MSKSKSGRPSPWKGKTPSESSRKQMSESAKKRGPLPKEIYKQIGKKVSKTKSGVKFSEEHKSALRGLDRPKTKCKCCGELFLNPVIKRHETKCFRINNS